MSEPWPGVFVWTLVFNPIFMTGSVLAALQMWRNYRAGRPWRSPDPIVVEQAAVLAHADLAIHPTLVREPFTGDD